jgi:hypothetical protein
MAYTATLQKTDVKGSERVSHYLVTADAASGVVASNIGVISAVQMAPVSMASSGIKLKINTSAASAAANGSVMVSSAANGDAFFLTVWGK